jgi:glycosyl hydrolase family 76
MIEYWYYTGDDRYNQWITDGILFQTGPDNNFEPVNQTRTEVCIASSVHEQPNCIRVTMIKHSGHLLP